MKKYLLIVAMLLCSGVCWACSDQEYHKWRDERMFYMFEIKDGETTIFKRELPNYCNTLITSGFPLRVFIDGREYVPKDKSKELKNERAEGAD